MILPDWGYEYGTRCGISLANTKQVFDAVAAECEKQGIMIHLDNHISKAKWCCNSQDNNSWFGDREFDADKWRRAWGYMANYVSLGNKTIVSILTPPS